MNQQLGCPGSSFPLLQDICLHYFHDENDGQSAMNQTKFKQIQHTVRRFVGVWLVVGLSWMWPCDPSKVYTSLKQLDNLPMDGCMDGADL